MSSDAVRGAMKAGKENSGRIDYKPKHPDDPTEVEKGDSNRTGYVGMADGVQSEGSTDEAREYLDIDTHDYDGKGLRIRNPGMRARYTRVYNEG